MVDHTPMMADHRKGENRMTFCKLLKEHKENGISVSAFEKTEKFETMPTYEIYISHDGIVTETISAARTTWARKFAETVKNL